MSPKLLIYKVQRTTSVEYEMQTKEKQLEPKFLNNMCDLSYLITTINKTLNNLLERIIDYCQDEDQIIILMILQI